MRITAHQLNRATLCRQLLLRREPLGVDEALRRVVALQAQQPASPYVALWNRLSAFDPADLDAAFVSHTLVKATLMRITLHVVHVDDHPAMHQAMQPTLRSGRLDDSRFTTSGLSAADADAVVPDLLQFLSEPRTGAEVEAWLGALLGVPAKGVWWALRSYAPLLHAPPADHGPSVSGRPTSQREPGRRRVTGTSRTSPCGRWYGATWRGSDRHQWRTWRSSPGYNARGPGARCGLSPMNWSTWKVPTARSLFDVPVAPHPAGDTPAPPRLLPMWDSILLAYADRSRVMPPDYRRLVARSNGDVLPTLLVDGYVAGVWRPTEAGIEATAFHPLTDEAWDGLAAEAKALVAFLGAREAQIYHRYVRWWNTLPTAEVHVLPG